MNGYCIPSEENGTPWTAAGEHVLWHRWRHGGDVTARERLLAHYLPYARAMSAKTYARRTHDAVEFDDYYQFAAIGMLEAFERFDPANGAQFKTFATPRIVGAILNGLERLTETQQQIALRRRIQAERAASLATDEVLRNDSPDLLRRLGDIGVGVALGLILEDTGLVASPEQALPDNAYARVELRQLREHLWSVVEQLTARERQVVRLHYLQHIPFEEIARELELTKGRVSQLHHQALKRLQRLLTGLNRLDLTL